MKASRSDVCIGGVLMSGHGIVTAGVPRGGEIKHKDGENEEHRNWSSFQEAAVVQPT
ncbi:unnamed protein product, partial [Gadus morhua 'NCC']